jgi:hypothetical protein
MLTYEGHPPVPNDVDPIRTMNLQCNEVLRPVNVGLHSGKPTRVDYQIAGNINSRFDLLGVDRCLVKPPSTLVGGFPWRVTFSRKRPG